MSIDRILLMSSRAFYFDSIDGFGEWTILISNNADARLRNTRKKEQKTFDIIVKKIKCVGLKPIITVLMSVPENYRPGTFQMTTRRSWQDTRQMFLFTKPR